MWKVYRCRFPGTAKDGNHDRRLRVRRRRRSRADTRVSTGIYVSNRASDKMTVLEDTTVMCRSGSAADTEAIASFVRYHVEQIGMERNGPLDVRTVARIANQINYQNKGANQGLGLSAYMIIGGWDEKHGAQVYSCTAGGNMIQNKWTTDGSGSTFIWGFMDEGFKVCFSSFCRRAFFRSVLLHFVIFLSVTSVGSFLNDKVNRTFTFPHCLLMIISEQFLFTLVTVRKI